MSGKGFGFVVRGLILDGQVVFYRTPGEEEAKRQEELAENERKQKEEFERNRESLDAKYDALPEVFRRRIDKFRTNNPDFRWKYETYEMFCCTQAVVIAEAMKHPNDDGTYSDESGVFYRAAISTFHDLPCDQQKERVSGLDEGHSGNTFGFACLLALDYLICPEFVIKRHGAMAPLVGSEEYGCVSREPKRDAMMEKVRDINHLLELADQHRCVTLVDGQFQGMFGHRNYQPAAWVANMSASVVHMMFPYLCVYEPKTEVTTGCPSRNGRQPHVFAEDGTCIFCDKKKGTRRAEAPKET